MKLKVEAIRKQIGMTQEEMAYRLNMSPGTYVSRENKKTDWKAKELAKIAKMANVPIDQIDFQ